MSPEIPTILQFSLQRLAGGVGEHGAAFAAGQVGLIGMMLTLSAKEYERGADIRHTENEDLRALFGALAPDVGDAGLKARLEEAEQSKDESLRISVLNAKNYALRRLVDRGSDIRRGQWCAGRAEAYMGRPESDGRPPPCLPRSLNQPARNRRPHSVFRLRGPRRGWAAASIRRSSARGWRGKG